MKTKCTILFIALSFIFQKVNAQSFALQTTTGTPVNYGDTLVISGTTNDFLLSGSIGVINNSSSSKSVQVRRENLSLITGATISFAWGLITYDTLAAISTDAVAINSGATDNSFNSNYNVYGLPGVSFVRYTFFDENNPSDSAWLVFQYNVTQAAGITESLNLKSISVSPNPGNGIFTVSSNESFSKGSIEIYDALGTLILTKVISDKSKSFVIDVSNQSNGYYVLRIKHEMNLSTLKLKLFKN